MARLVLIVADTGASVRVGDVLGRLAVGRLVRVPRHADLVAEALVAGPPVPPVRFQEGHRRASDRRRRRRRGRGCRS